MNVHVAVILGFLACFGSFTWSIHGGFFRVPGGRLTPAARITKRPERPLRAPPPRCFAAFTAHARWLAAIALLVYGKALALFWSSIYVNRTEPLSVAFNNDQPGHLIAHGPYRHIRHPFYLSRTCSPGPPESSPVVNSG